MQRRVWVILGTDISTNQEVVIKFSFRTNFRVTAEELERLRQKEWVEKAESQGSQRFSINVRPQQLPDQFQDLSVDTEEAIQDFTAYAKQIMEGTEDE